MEKIKKRYMNICSINNSKGVDDNTLNKIEQILNVKLPYDYRKIASFYEGGGVGIIEEFAIAYENITPNIVEETIRLRKAINLPHRFIFIAEPSESVIVMDTENTPSIIWCDATDVDRINNKSFSITPNTWNTYLEFFEYMLDDEEEEQRLN